MTNNNLLICHVSPKAPGRWSIRGIAGTRPVSRARDASSRLAPRASSQRTTTTSACPATRSSLPCSVCTARRYCRIAHCVNWSYQPHGDSTFKWLNAPFPFFHQPITTGGVTYREQPWHKDCFLCTSCKLQLTGQRFTSRDDFAYCLNCFCNLYAKKCASCTTPISGNDSSALAQQNIK